MTSLTTSPVATLTPRSPLQIATTDRACFFGATGSGKTTLALTLLRGVRSWVVLDAKHRIRVDGVPIVTAFDPRLSRQIIRAPFPAEDWDTPLMQAWMRGGIVVYSDETTLINPKGAFLSPALGRVIRTGRELGVGAWMGSQRPKKIPSEVYTEAEHFFIFQLRYKPDRQRVIEATSDAVGVAIDSLKGHEFVYFNAETGDIRKMILDLGDKAA